jgi:hypothetical protein
MSKMQSIRLRDLLLHKLSSVEAEQMEDRILQDGNMADQVEVAANDLLDDYVRGLLTPADARLVEKHLLNAPDAPQRLAFAKALAESRPLNQRLQPPDPERAIPFFRTPAFAIAMAVCALILVFSIVELQYRRKPESAAVLPQPATGNSSAGPAPSSANSGTEKNTGSSFTIALLADQVRGDKERKFVIPSGIEMVRIQCEVPAANRSLEFRMDLRDAAGYLYSSFDNLRPIDSAGIFYVEGTLSAAELKSGRYSASVSSRNPSSNSIISYDFVLKNVLR